jgi:HAD superfamily hydrolase (TIGR01509 family)
LKLTGLFGLFSPNLFSASMVARGKPAPDLFLYAASGMGTEPRHCLVIDDSAAGVRARKAAGMAVFGFVGGSHVVPAVQAATMEAAGSDLPFD